MNRAEAEDGLHVRAALEVLAVRQALERLSQQQWDQLCGRYDTMLQNAWRAAATTDAVAGIEFDIAWHTLLVESAGNQALARTWSMNRAEAEDGLHVEFLSGPRGALTFS